METRQVVALVIVIAVIALALGATMGYNLSSGRISTIIQTGKTSTTTQTDTITTSVVLGSSSTTQSIFSANTTGQAICCYATTFTTSANIVTSEFAQVTGANSSTVAPNATVCIELAEGTIQLTILNNATNKPVPNVSAEASTLTSNGFPTPCTLLRLVTQTLTTGANGTVSFCCDTGFYNVTVGYSGLTYLIQTVIEPERCTGVILFVPIGKTIITTSQDLGSCPSN